MEGTTAFFYHRQIIKLNNSFSHFAGHTHFLMEPYTPSLATILTVSQLNGRIRELLENALPYVRVRGEIFDLKMPASGHLYFTLADGEAQIRAVVWRTARMRITHSPRNGEAVQVTGRVTVYPPRGEYQLVVEAMTPAGSGSDREMLLKLHAQLNAEGIFSPQRKKPLPLLPRIIGVVTSRSGAALQDILRVLDERMVGYHLILAHARVQGDGAAAEIAAALDRLNQDGRCQVILCGRGGGSADDLSAFNSELVVRAIARSKIPVISAVGHEVDTSLADLAADLRAATPTAAAQRVAGDRQALQERLTSLQQRLLQAARKKMLLHQEHLKRTLLQLRHPRQRIESHRLRCDELPERLARAIHHRLLNQQQHLQHLQQRLATVVHQPLDRRRHRLATLLAALHSLSPAAVLQRGYALVHNQQGQIVRQADSLQPNDSIQVTLAQGSLQASVVHIKNTI
ncbi:MAG: exodeoxyribonuclease VII large subunit [Magnetococcales bacterium]|nr:exodeoxyribonuclease VII large subunit [Magnetococcales bacterium]